MLQQRRAVGECAGSATLSAYVGSRTQTIVSFRRYFYFTGADGYRPSLTDLFEQNVFRLEVAVYEAVASESLQAVQDRVSELAHEVHRETAKLVPLRHLKVRRTAPVRLASRLSNILRQYTVPFGWFGSRVVSVLDTGAEGPGFKSQPRHCRVTVLGKLFTPIVPLFTKQRNW